MMRSNQPIGVFDSGLGGLSVLGELWKLMPNEKYIYIGDSKNAPYGTKSECEIKKYTEENITKLINMGVKAVVIACNTATSVAANELREIFSIPIIGIEPAIKPAAENHKGGNIIVMATPMTLKKEKFKNLMNSYNDISNIVPLPCPNLVEIIEKGITSGKEIDEYLNKLFIPYKKEKISAIVLGCTHYPFIKDSIKSLFSYDIDIIDGAKGTARETKRRLEEEGLLNTVKENGKIEFLSSLDKKEETELMKCMFELTKNM